VTKAGDENDFDEVDDLFAECYNILDMTQRKPTTKQTKAIIFTMPFDMEYVQIEPTNLLVSKKN
jgi:hypothetical protein